MGFNRREFLNVLGLSGLCAAGHFIFPDVVAAGRSSDKPRCLVPFSLQDVHKFLIHLNKSDIMPMLPLVSAITHVPIKHQLYVIFRESKTEVCSGKRKINIVQIERGTIPRLLKAYGSNCVRKMKHLIRFANDEQADILKEAADKITTGMKHAGSGASKRILELRNEPLVAMPLAFERQKHEWSLLQEYAESRGLEIKEPVGLWLVHNRGLLKAKHVIVGSRDIVRNEEKTYDTVMAAFGKFSPLIPSNSLASAGSRLVNAPRCG